MLKILQASLQQYMNRELPDVQVGFRKGRGTRDQISKICWIVEKAREFQKSIYFCFIDYAKAFDLVDHNKLEILQEMGITDHLTCLLRNPYVGQETTKDLHDPDNHNGVITHLEPDILECEVKWASKSITTNKANGGDEFHLSYFKF